MVNGRGKNKKRVLVTGGTGFVGGHLVNDLLIAGYEVITADIKLDPRSTFVLNGTYKHSELRIADVTDKDAVFNLIRSNKFNYIIHLAAQTLVTTAYQNPLETLRTNILGTVNILEASRQYNVEGVIVASSDKAYGKTDEAYTENFQLKGDHPYDVSKSSADLISLAYHKTYKLPVTVTRFGNVYGEGDLYFDRIVPGICKSIITNKILKIRSNGKFVRDYLYVKDVANGYVFLLENMDKLKGEAFNFSSQDKLSVLELIKSTEEVVDEKIKYKILNNANNEIPFQHLNDEKIKTAGWENKYVYKKVFPQILEWYRNIMLDK